jgi:hypothetical protein
MGLPTSVFSFENLPMWAKKFKNQCQGYKGVQRSFSENMHQSHHVLREKKSEAIIFREYIHKNKAKF